MAVGTVAGGGPRQQHGGPVVGAPEPPEQEGGHGQQQHRQGEATGHAVGEPLNRGLAQLGLLHQVHDAGDGAFAAPPQHLKLQRSGQVETASREFAAGLGGLGEGFTGEGRGVHRGAALTHQPIHRNAVAREDANPVARAQAPHPHRPGRPAIHQQQGLIGLKQGQGLDGAAGAVAGPLLQEAASQHETQQHHGLVEEAGPAPRRPEPAHQTGQVGTAHPQPHQGVHAGGPGEGGAPPSNEDASAWTRQSRTGQQGMEPGLGQGGARQAEGTGIGQMAQTRHQHQSQGHHQLPPTLPPVALLKTLTTAERVVIVLAPGPGREAELLEALQQGWQALLGPIQLHPGGAGEQIHAGLPHPLLLVEALFHRPHAAAAFHPFHIKQQGLTHRTGSGGGMHQGGNLHGGRRRRGQVGLDRGFRLGRSHRHAPTKRQRRAGWCVEQDVTPCPAPSATTTSSTRASR